MDESEQPPEYWEGVKDALNLVRDFLYWKDLNPETSQTTKEFILDSMEKLVNYARPRLQDLLDLRFKKKISQG